MIPFEAGGGPLGPLLPHDWSEIIIGAILFAIIFAVLLLVVMPRFEATYLERSAAIEGGLERAEQAQLKADAALAQYNEQLAGARDEAAAIREEAKGQGARIIEDMRAQAKTEADRIVAQARAQIDAERTQAVTSLRGDIGGLATTLAEKIVGETLSDDERAQRTIDRFLAELDAEPVSQA